MLEAAPFHLPDGSLGLFCVTANTKGPSSPHWVLQFTSISCPPLGSPPSCAGYSMIS